MLSNINFKKQCFSLLKLTNYSSLKYLSTSEILNPIKLSFAAYETPTKNITEPPFIILHGLFGSKQNWTSLSKAYHQKSNPQRKVIAVDLRNHGDSPHDKDHTYDHLAGDLKQFLNDQGIEQISLMGHSMGGRCAMLFALKYPELVEKLIVVDISPVATSPNLHEIPNVFDIMANIKMPSNVSLSQARNIVDHQLAEYINDKALRAFLLTNLVDTENQRYNWRINVPSLKNNFKNISTFPYVNELKYLGHTLFIGGGKSDYIVKYLPNAFQKRTKSGIAEYNNMKALTNLAYVSYQTTETTKLNENPTPLILVHGLFGSKGNYHTLCKRFHESTKPKRLVCAVDLRNHGDSVHLLQNSYDDLVMDIVKFLYIMHLHKVVVIGHDIGGRVGMLLALKYPDIVDKLIVADISPISTSQNFKTIPEVLRALKTLYFPKNLPFIQAKALAANHLARVVKEKGLLSFLLTNLVQTTEGSYTWRFNLKALLDNFDQLASFPDLHNITFRGPVLFIGGSRSDYIQKSDYPKILKLFPKAELRYIEGAGHWVHSEKPTDFLKLTLDFLNQKSPTR